MKTEDIEAFLDSIALQTTIIFKDGKVDRIAISGGRIDNIEKRWGPEIAFELGKRHLQNAVDHRKAQLLTAEHELAQYLREKGH